MSYEEDYDIDDEERSLSFENEDEDIVEGLEEIDADVDNLSIDEGSTDGVNASVSEATNNDYSSLFTTDINFNSREEVIGWVRKVGQENKMVFSVCRVKKSVLGSLGKTWLSCEKYGAYNPKKVQPAQRKNSSTKKSGCEFMIQVFETYQGLWKVHVQCGVHNHKLGKNLKGHALAGRMNEDEKKLVKNMWTSNCTPAQIASALSIDKDNNTRMRQIYNQRQKLRKEGLDQRTVAQQFFFECRKEGYFCEHRGNKNGEVTDIFFAHPESVALLKAFPYVLVMDSTYNTNIYKMPFFEIIGFTSTWLNFNVAGAFLSTEKEENYVWAIEQLAKLCRRVERTPTTIVTDREKAFMNALDRIFPETQFLLCRRHIFKNIEGRARNNHMNKELARIFANSYSGLFTSKTEESYERRLNELEDKWKRRGHLLQYVRTQWLDPYKRRIVSAWTDQYLNFKSNTTNRAETAHSVMKQFMKTSSAKLDTIFRFYHSLMRIQLDKILGSFNESISKKITWTSCVKQFQSLHHNISLKAFLLIIDEYNKARANKPDGPCTCSFPTTHGLPCMHFIWGYMKKGMSIPLTDVHEFWKKLDIDDVVPDSEKGRDVRRVARNLMTEFCEKDFPNLSPTRQLDVVNKAIETAFPERTSLREPARVVTKGRPKDSPNKRLPSDWELAGTPPKKQRGRPPKNPIPVSSPSPIPVSSSSPNTDLPPKTPLKRSISKHNPDILVEWPGAIRIWMKKYVISWNNVRGDGNCGFRALHHAIYGTDTDEGWRMIRRLMLAELISNRKLHEGFFHQRDIDETIVALGWNGDGFAPPEYWFSVTDMGCLAATVLQCIVVAYGGCDYTYVPLYRREEGITSNFEFPEIHISIVPNQYRYIRLTLEEDCPLPAILKTWAHFRNDTVDGIEVRLAHRIARWKELHLEHERITREYLGTIS